jgi:hypothetical protein
MKFLIIFVGLLSGPHPFLSTSQRLRKTPQASQIVTSSRQGRLDGSQHNYSVNRLHGMSGMDDAAGKVVCSSANCLLWV